MPDNFFAIQYGYTLEPRSDNDVSVTIVAQRNPAGTITSAQLVVKYTILPDDFRSVPPDAHGGFPLQADEIGYATALGPAPVAVPVPAPPAELHSTAGGDEFSVTFVDGSAYLNLRVPLADPKKDYVD